jgi:hypothetical protein
MKEKMNTTNKTWKLIALALALALILVVALGIGGWVITHAYAQRPWGGYGGYGMMGPGRMGGWSYGRNYGMMGPGMMGGWGSYGGGYGMMGAQGYSSGHQDCDMLGSWGDTYPEGTETLTLEEAEVAVERSLNTWNNADLAVSEVMEFSNHFYAIVQEESTGIGAFEVLVDKVTGAVSPEPGPNMMWNQKYGMMGGYGMGMMGGGYGYGGIMGGGRGYGGMMGGATESAPSLDMPIDEAQAIELAQEYIDTARPGTTADEEADAFYGYYTLHVLTDGQVSGMLSVNGYTGQVWYHTWHGTFMDMDGTHQHRA